jgi:hypothetical protein
MTAEEDASVNGFVETEDFRNAYEAFLAKRKPVFRGH